MTSNFMHTSKFIEDAIKGGWMLKGNMGGEISHYDHETNTFTMKHGGHWYRPAIEVILLDPSAWAAVGKTRGWKKDDEAIKQLEKDIEYENHYYENALANPTETEQFYQALERHREKIQIMNSRLEAYKSNQDFREYMHRFLDYLIEGKSIEEALSEIK